MKSYLDDLRDKYDDASKKLVAQMRAKIRTRKDAHTHNMEMVVKFLPDSLERWTAEWPDFSHLEFEAECDYSGFAIIDWRDDKNKAKIWFDAYHLLREEEQKAIKAWRV